MQFKSDFVYTDRRSKAKYIFCKYQSILQGKILDVGADHCFLKEYIEAGTQYVGIGLHSPKLDIVVDLEKQDIPFESNSFDTVLCSDVLEHLDTIHHVFDEICRVSNSHVIVALPNAHKAFWEYIKRGDYCEEQHMKFYGLPLEKPEDRHKWFFSSWEAEKFVRYRAEKNNMAVVQIDYSHSERSPIKGLKHLLLTRIIHKLITEIKIPLNLMPNCGLPQIS